MWPKDSYSIGKIQESYDKQLLRDWLTNNGYQKEFDEARAKGKEPIAPTLPDNLIKKMTERYVIAYERFTKKPI